MFYKHKLRLIFKSGYEQIIKCNDYKIERYYNGGVRVKVWNGFNKQIHQGDLLDVIILR